MSREDEIAIFQHALQFLAMRLAKVLHCHVLLHALSAARTNFLLTFHHRTVDRTQCYFSACATTARYAHQTSAVWPCPSACCEIPNMLVVRDSEAV